MATVKVQVVVDGQVRRVCIVINGVLGGYPEIIELIARQGCPKIETAQRAAWATQEVQIIVIGDSPELAGPGLTYRRVVDFDKGVAKPQVVVLAGIESAVKIALHKPHNGVALFLGDGLKVEAALIGATEEAGFALFGIFVDALGLQIATDADAGAFVGAEVEGEGGSGAKGRGYRQRHE